MSLHECGKGRLIVLTGEALQQLLIGHVAARAGTGQLAEVAKDRTEPAVGHLAELLKRLPHVLNAAKRADKSNFRAFRL